MSEKWLALRRLPSERERNLAVSRAPRERSLSRRPFQGDAQWRELCTPRGSTMRTDGQTAMCFVLVQFFAKGPGTLKQEPAVVSCPEREPPPLPCFLPWKSVGRVYWGVVCFHETGICII